MGARGPKALSILVRLARKSRRLPNGCVEWTGSRWRGYGIIRVGSAALGTRRMGKTHIEAWEAAYGPVPEGQWVLHRCDNRACMNITCLFLGTAADNTADMVSKGRGWWQNGAGAQAA